MKKNFRHKDVTLQLYLKSREIEISSQESVVSYLCNGGRSIIGVYTGEKSDSP